MPKKIEKKVLITTIIFFCVMMTVMILFCVSDLSVADNKAQMAQDDAPKDGALHYKYQVPYSEDTSGIDYLVIPLPGVNTDKDVIIHNDYTSKQITLEIDGMQTEKLCMQGISGNLQGVEECWCEPASDGLKLHFLMDSLYECDMQYEKHELHLQFVKPKEMFERIVVLDAGHGGEDTGYSSGESNEKNLVFDIANRLKECLQAEDVKVYCSRESDTALTEEERSAFIEQTGADFAISLHMGYDESDEEHYGVCSYYNSKFFIHDFGSGDLAYTLESFLSEVPDIKGLGIMEGENEYPILSRVNIPMTVVELGYMTNAKEMLKWSSDNYRQELAEAICDGILDAYTQKEE